MDRIQKAIQMISNYEALVANPETSRYVLSADYAQIVLHLIRAFDPPTMDPSTFRRNVFMQATPDDISQVPIEYFPFVALRKASKLSCNPNLTTTIITDDGELVQPFAIFAEMYHDYVCADAQHNDFEQRI